MIRGAGVPVGSRLSGGCFSIRSSEKRNRKRSPARKLQLRQRRGFGMIHNVGLGSGSLSDAARVNGRGEQHTDNDFTTQNNKERDDA